MILVNCIIVYLPIKSFLDISDTPKEASLLLILKWGGELTPSGRVQAEELGRVFRCMYPGGQGNTQFLSGIVKAKGCVYFLRVNTTVLDI